jgi:hypothetical protein
VSEARRAAPRESSAPGLALASTPLCALLLFLPGGGWLLALAAPLTLWPTFAPAIRSNRDGAAFRAAVLWAILLSVGVLLFATQFPEAAARSVVRGESYRSEMFGWIETGVGKEGDWRRFLPEHAVHLGAFALLSLLTAGYLGLALGAALMAYMNYFVAGVAAASGEPIAAITTAWFPWSIARVLAFIAFGVLLARPLLRRERWPFERRHARWFALALLGIAVDIGLKVALAASFRERLLELVR